MRNATFLIGLVAVTITSQLAVASVVLKHDEDSLTRASDAVVVGQVLSSRSKWNDAHEFIWTVTRVRVDNVAAGQAAPKQTLIVRELGGSVGDFNQALIGAASFSTGENVLLFLERAKDGTPGVYQTVGLSEGKFLVSMDAATGRALAVSAAHDLHYAGTAHAMWDDGPVDLEDLLAAARGHGGSKGSAGKGARAKPKPGGGTSTTPCGGSILSNPRRSWNLAIIAAPIQFGINSSVVPSGGGLSPSEVVDATIAGAQEWNKVKANLVSAAVDNVNCPRGFVDDRRNCISYEDPQNLLSGSTVAASVVGWYNSSTHSCTTPKLGTLTFNDYRDSDVVFNNGVRWTRPDPLGGDTCKSGCTTFPFSSAQYDIDGVTVQEAGHSLGLDHSANTADSMYGSINACNCTKQSATSCDIEAGSNLCY